MTKEETKMSENYVCEFCGKSYRKRLLPKAYLGNHCHDCSFWLRKQYLSEEDKKRQTIVDGCHYMYMVTNEDEELVFRGYGGRAFHILFHDGREVKTSNLWSQGKIPQEFRHLFPDNAQLIPVEEPLEKPIRERVEKSFEKPIEPQYSEFEDDFELPF